MDAVGGCCAALALLAWNFLQSLTFMFPPIVPYVQDTNALVFRALTAALGVSVKVIMFVEDT